MSEQTRLPIVFAGHVDHGKSTLVGRLLADTGSLPNGKLEQVRELCRRTSKPFEYAFLLDALKDEQSQGITIDVARIFFRTAKREYLIIDAPGHVEFLKNMVSGASHAAAALLVVDAKEGVRENSRRHAVLAAMLGIRQTAVLVNKLDLVGRSEAAFKRIVDEYRPFLAEAGVSPRFFIPVSGFHGDNVASRSAAMPWYDGPSLVEALDAFEADRPLADRPLRLPVQDVYKFTAYGDERRIVAGTVAAGRVAPGDELVFYPSGKTSVVSALEGFPDPPAAPVSAGGAVGFQLREQIYIRRGELAALRDQPPPKVAARIQASLFWLGKKALEPGREYLLKIGTARAHARLEKAVRVLDASTLATVAGRDKVERHEAADCILALDRPIAFDLAADCPLTGRFVIVDDYEISGGGLVREALADPAAGLREQVLRRNLKWQKGLVSSVQREETYGQKACLVLVTGSDDELRKETAKRLEAELHEAGRKTYFLGIGSVLYGVDADIRSGPPQHEEDMRRLGEVAHILLDAGLIVIVTARELSAADAAVIGASVDGERVETVWVGGPVATDLRCGLKLPSSEPGEAASAVLGRLRARGFV